LLTGSLLPAMASGQGLVINEVMSSNGRTLFDDTGSSPDWIEIHNPQGVGVRLDGCGLTDNDDPFKWVFPPIVVPAGGHLVVFASGDDRRDAAPHWETVIDRGDVWRYLVPTFEPAASWRRPGFDDSGWSSGRTGIGYGDGDDATEVPAGTISVYARKTFHIDDPTTVTHAFLDVDFDDAFVAFLNGQEIARENIADLGRPPTYREVSDDYTEPRLAYGRQPFHYAIANFRELLRAGENVLAIQVHNTGAGSSDLTLIPFLTLGMEEVPAGARGAAELLRSNLPSLHTNFKISSDGEAISLTSAEGLLLDTVITGELPTDISYGRFPDGTGEFSYHIEPTPGTTNDAPGYSAISGRPAFSRTGGFYPDAITLELSTDDALGTTYVTLDGSIPTTESPRYTSPIAIDSTTVVRARVLGDDALPGRTVSHTFFIGDSFTLPVVSISTDPANFFDREIGIYVTGDDFSPDFPHFGANFWEDWERPVHVQFFEPDGTVGFSADAGAKIFGGWSRGHPQRSLSVFARAQYGPTEFRHRIFPTKRINRFEAFVLRNSGNDWQRSHFRDGMMTSLLDDVAVDRQAYRPSVVFINAEYWGIMNLREKINEHYIESNHADEDVDSDAIDLLERNASTIHGDAEHYRALTELLQTRDVSDPTVYEQVASMVDIDNFIDYQAAQIYFDNTDWPGNNIKFWRPRTEDGRWRWILFDTDFGFGIWDGNRYTNNTLAFALAPNGPNWPNPPWSTLMLRQLITNDEFVEDFVNRFATHINTIFAGTKVVDRIDAMAAVIEPEMPAQRRRWGSNVSTWTSNVQVMRNFATRRGSYVRSHLRSIFGLAATTSLRLDVSPTGGGAVEVQGLPITTYPFRGTYFRDLPIRLVARPTPGYRFTGWVGASPADAPETSVVVTGLSQTVSAAFETDCETIGRVVINEVCYNAPEDADPGDWVELHNRTRRTVDLSGCTFRDESDEHAFAIPDGTLLARGGFLVLCSDVAAFTSRYPDVDGVYGDLGFSLAGDGEELRLIDASGETLDALTYGDEAPWPPEADGDGATLALTNPILDNTWAPHWAASAAGGTPGADNADVLVEVESECVDDEVLFLRGDGNGDGDVDVSDAVFILDWRFLGGTTPDCVAATNANGDGDIDLSDAVYVLSSLFLGGDPPVPPFPSCGAGTLESDELLGCEGPPAACE